MLKKKITNKNKKIKLLTKKKTVFLDRDGVINYDYGYVYKKKDFVWKKKIIEAIKYLNNNDYLVIVISNQSGIGRGYYKHKDVLNLHLWINKKLKTRGAHIDDFFYAPYYKHSKIFNFKNADRLERKPNIGMVKKALKKWKINLKNSAIIGDKNSDLELAKKLKIKGIRVNDKSNLLNLVKKFF